MQTTQKEWRLGLVALHTWSLGAEDGDLALRTIDDEREWVAKGGKWYQEAYRPWKTSAQCWGSAKWVGTREEFEALRARAETPADLLRLAREAAAEQKPDVAELAWWSFLDVTRAALQAKHAAEAIGCAPANLLRDVKGLVEQRDAATARAEEAEREICRRDADSTTIHTMLHDIGIGCGPQVERVRQLVDAWRLLISTHNATIQEVVEGRAAAETKLEALEDCNRAQMEIILDYLEAAGLPRNVDGGARAGLREISRLVALADAVREIVGGPADAEALRSAWRKARKLRAKPEEITTIAQARVGCTYRDVEGDLWFCHKSGTLTFSEPDSETYDSDDDVDPAVAFGPLVRIG